MPRLLLKLSGEALGGETGTGLSPDVLQRMGEEISGLTNAGIEVALVLGGGNLFRGQALARSGMDRVVGDRMGMLATVMNGLAMSDFLRQANVANQLYASVDMAGLVAGYNRDVADQALREGKVVILSGGTGSPFFTTDTAACLRGVELGVDAVLKATNVDGVYDCDPKTNPAAIKFDSITYDEVLERGLGVMDLTAIVLCKENNMPLVVFDMHEPGALLAVAQGKPVGTRVVAER